MALSVRELVTENSVVVGKKFFLPKIRLVEMEVVTIVRNPQQTAVVCEGGGLRISLGEGTRIFQTYGQSEALTPRGGDMIA